MASTIQIKQSLAANDTLKERIVWEGLLELVDLVKSKEPRPESLDSKAAERFFRARLLQANTIAGQAAQNPDGSIDYNRISGLSATVLGFASDLVDRAVAEAGGANPWEAVPDDSIDAATQSVVDGLTKEQIIGGAELSFNGLAGIGREEMERVIELNLWKHPFGLPAL
jgi:hypothetical protein